MIRFLFSKDFLGILGWSSDKDLELSLLGAWVRSLVQELRSHKTGNTVNKLKVGIINK